MRTQTPIVKIYVQVWCLQNGVFGLKPNDTLQTVYYLIQLCKPKSQIKKMLRILLIRTSGLQVWWVFRTYILYRQYYPILTILILYAYHTPIVRPPWSDVVRIKKGSRGHDRLLPTSWSHHTLLLIGWSIDVQARVEFNTHATPFLGGITSILPVRCMYNVSSIRGIIMRVLD